MCNPTSSLQAAGERRPEPLQYLGASFGLTQPLLNFWRRGGYQPVYLRQTASDVTGAGTAGCEACFCVI
jgi:tRNA(Met) C34 N-acetyltransferase TmcA